MNPHSIRFRLTAWYAAILAATFAASGVGVRLALRGSINDTVDKELRSRLMPMREFLERHAIENAVAEDLVEDAAFAPAGARYRIADPSGHSVFQTPGASTWPSIPAHFDELPPRGRFETAMFEGKPFRVLTASARPFVMQIAMPLDEFQEMLDAFAWTALIASPLLLLLASGAGYWMSRRALAPVEQIAHAAAEIEARNLSERLPLRGSKDELDHLSQTLNAMLGRLEDGFRKITRFTADASHELRTPIAVIRTTAEVTRRKPRSEQDYAEALDRILAESERTTKLVEDLMLLARADAREAAIDSQPVDLAEVAQSACGAARSLAEKAGIDLELESTASVTIAGDYEPLYRLTMILLDNAIKYSRPAGRVRVCVHLATWKNRPTAVIEVRDNGIGISPEDLPHLFDRFYRVSKDRSRRVDGVGLGLSIAQSIAHRHGAEIQVESELGAGTAVHVYLPAGLSARHSAILQNSGGDLSV